MMWSIVEASGRVHRWRMRGRSRVESRERCQSVLGVSDEVMV